MEGMSAYNATRPVKYPIVSHVRLAWDSEAPAMIILQREMGVVHKVSLLDYQTYSDGQMYSLPAYIEPRVWWKDWLYKIIPVVVGVVFALFLLMLFFAITAG